MTSPDQPDPQMIAAQLRKPSGEAAGNVGDNMDQVNEPLFTLALAAMRPAAHERILEIGFGTGTYLSRLFGEAEELEVDIRGQSNNSPQLEIFGVKIFGVRVTIRSLRYP